MEQLGSFRLSCLDKFNSFTISHFHFIVERWEAVQDILIQHNIALSN